MFEESRNTDRNGKTVITQKRNTELHGNGSNAPNTELHGNNPCKPEPNKEIHGNSPRKLRVVVQPASPITHTPRLLLPRPASDFPTTIAVAKCRGAANPEARTALLTRLTRSSHKQIVINLLNDVQYVEGVC